MVPHAATEDEVHFPIRALDLVVAVSTRFESQFKELELATKTTFLPRAIRAVMAHDDVWQANLGHLSSAEVKDISAKLSQILWSHPGSVGSFKIEKNLRVLGLEEDIADELATRIYGYTRYVMSLVNSARMTRSACSTLIEALDTSKFRNRFMNVSYLPMHISNSWPEESADLGSRTLQNLSDLPDWLDKVEIFIRKVNSANSLARKSANILLEKVSEKKDRSSSSSASSTKRLFGQLLFNDYGFDKLPSRYHSKKGSYKVQIEELRESLDTSDANIFGLLKSNYEDRKHKITANPKQAGSLWQNKLADSLQNTIVNTTDINGRKITIKSNSDTLSPELINQMYKIFLSQMKLGNKNKIFTGKAKRADKELVVDLEDPKLSDANKLRLLLKLMFDSE